MKKRKIYSSCPNAFIGHPSFRFPLKTCGNDGWYLVSRITSMRILFLCTFISGSQAALSQERYGAGIIIGTPTAICAQVLYPSLNSLDFILSSDFNEEVFFQSHYDFRIAALKEDREGIYAINMYAGPGMFLQTYSNEKNSFGIGGNIGFSWMFRNRYDFFLEYAPKLSFTEPAAVKLTGGFGFRYVF